jgi:hypothetical protein
MLGHPFEPILSRRRESMVGPGWIAVRCGG